MRMPSWRDGDTALGRRECGFDAAMRLLALCQRGYEKRKICALLYRR